jgi:hypothetical protein
MKPREYFFEVTKNYGAGNESVVLVHIEAPNKNTALGKIRKMFREHNPDGAPEITIKKITL